MTSQLKTALLLGALTAIIVLIGRAIGGPGGMVIAFIIAVAMNVGSYWYSDKIVLRMYKAKELAEHDAPAIHKMVDDLAREAGIPKPKLMLVPQQQPNAFATGRSPSNAVVAVTQGIVQTLSPEELKGVIAHEMGHIKNRDILIQSIAAVLGGAIMILANIAQFTAIFGGMGGNDDEGGNPIAALALAIIAPFAAMLIQMAISRSREYLADRTGAALCHHPEHLASALEKISAHAQRQPMKGANPATENMFIISPFSAGRAAHLFATHPPVEDRVARLRSMAGKV
ncbi:zinc metalloprotease HtpX [Desulfohalovibrio reitneri]|uniref:zinc metalloprotease HtpX n=1 Tax=Desulfohalovibrio reitneri TaxID=1307759 RepID=UPI0004A6C58A|nr:zinc metalloprotease HtpX [Desulfohalovibrio reitneri]